MARKISLVLLLVALIVAAVPAQAQGANAWTVYQLNMRTGPAPTYDSVTALASNTGLILEARNEDASWVLGRTEDGVYRGWVSSLYLRFDTGFNSFNLPVSGEIVGTAPAAPAQPTAPEQPAPSGDAAGGSATVASTMNVRSGPGTTFGVIGQIRGGTQVILEGRNEAANWVLAHATDGAIRGWMFVQYLRFSGVTVTDLPVTGEIAESSESGIVAPTTNVNYNGVDMHGYDPARIEGIDLTQYPVVARATSRSRAIFQAGQALGNNSGVLAKIGDCSTEHWYFLKPFAWGDYNLGAYGSLQSTIDHFGDSLAYDSVASHNGFNANAVMAPEWSDPAYCQAGESPIECEFRIHKPSIAVIMFGTSDLLVMTPYEFDFYLRSMVDQTIEAGVIPVMSTFPGNQGFWDRTIIFNQIVVRIALDYDIPLINLWLALESLPNHGLEADGFHLGEPPSEAGACVLTPDNLQTGYPTRNLVTLQSLDAIWRGAMQ